MQTCTAMQLPTSRLQVEHLKFALIFTYKIVFFFFYIQIVQCLPQTDVVLHRKLDPVNYLRKLRYHCQQCDTNKVLEHTQNHWQIEQKC